MHRATQYTAFAVCIGSRESRHKTLRSNTKNNAGFRLCYLGPPIKSLALPKCAAHTVATASEFAARDGNAEQELVSTVIPLIFGYVYDKIE